jgi:hypothetical protein
MRTSKVSGNSAGMVRSAAGGVERAGASVAVEAPSARGWLRGVASWAKVATSISRETSAWACSAAIDGLDHQSTFR